MNNGISDERHVIRHQQILPVNIAGSRTELATLTRQWTVSFLHSYYLSTLKGREPSNTRCYPRQHVKCLQGRKVMRSNADWLQRSWPSVTDLTPHKVNHKRLWTVTALHVDENEDHDWVVGQFNRAMNGAGEAVRAWCGPMKHTSGPELV